MTRRGFLGLFLGGLLAHHKPGHHGGPPTTTTTSTTLPPIPPEPGVFAAVFRSHF